jgi:hypothetical protein
MSIFGQRLIASLKYSLSALGGIAFALLITVVATVAVAVYRLPRDCAHSSTVTSVSEATSVSKKYLQEQGEQRLKKYDLDASITEYSQPLDREPQPCAGPPRWHIARAYREWEGLQGYSAVWAGYVKRGCPTCWEFYTVSVSVGKCGGAKIEGIGLRDFSYSSQTKDNTAPLCPPIYWPPSLNASSSGVR